MTPEEIVRCGREGRKSCVTLRVASRARGVHDGLNVVLSRRLLLHRLVLAILLKLLDRHKGDTSSFRAILELSSDIVVGNDGLQEALGRLGRVNELRKQN